MKIIIRSIAYIFLLVAFGAKANFIIDTGPGPGSNSGGVSLSQSQFLAGQFVIQQQTTIAGIEGWLGGSDGFGTVVLYDNNGNIPGNELFSTSFTGDFVDNWYGASQLSWSVDAGTYWAAFEVRSNQTFSGWMEDLAANSTPLAAYSFSSNGAYLASNIQLGFRIAAAQNVTSPSVFFLLMFAGLASIRFKRKA
jgi:hypothetical protein